MPKKRPAAKRSAARDYSAQTANGALTMFIKADHEDRQTHRFAFFHLLGHILSGDLDYALLLIDHDRIHNAADKSADQFAATLA